MTGRELYQRWAAGVLDAPLFVDLPALEQTAWHDLARDIDRERQDAIDRVVARREPSS